MTSDMTGVSGSAPAFTAAQTRTLLPFGALVAAIAKAARELENGRVVCPLRQVTALGTGGRLLSMSATAADLAVHKLVSVVPDNPRCGLPTIQGRLSVVDPPTGRVTMTLDAATVTGRRTAAVTMLGISTLSGASSASHAPLRILVIGTGVQVAHHLDAIADLFPQATVCLLGREPASARRFVGLRPASAHVVALERLADAPDVDVVVTCTSSRVPVYREPASRERLIVAVGSYEPDAAEIGADTVRASRVIVDDRAGAATEAGDLIVAGIDPTRIESLATFLEAPPPRDRPLLLKTVGCAAWDLAAARVAALVATSVASRPIELAAPPRPCENPDP